MKRNGRMLKFFRPSPIDERSDMNRELNEEWPQLNDLIWQSVGCVAEKPATPKPDDTDNNRDNNNGAEMNMNKGVSTSSTSSVTDLSYIWRDSQSTQSTELGSSSQTSTVEDYPADFRRIYVSNIPFKYTSIDLQRLCEPVGPVTHAEVIYNERGSKGFGFVSFANELSAKFAITVLNGVVIDGRKIEVHPATPKEKSAPKSKKKIVEEAAELQTLVLQKLQSLKFPDI